MKNNLKTIFAFFCIIILNNCGYAPLLDSKKINFYINDLNVSGDRQLVNLLTNKLEKFKNFNENAKEYNLDISNNYEKVMVNKDRSGNPKNWLLPKLKLRKTKLGQWGEIEPPLMRKLKLRKKI